MSYLELFHLISKPWASINEIRLIANCGRDSAIKIRNNIENTIKKEGKLLPERIKTINKSVLPDRLTPNFDK